MAVLTALTKGDASALLEQYDAGPLRSLAGLPAGSVNSNFRLETSTARLFFRLYEEQDEAGARHETAMLERLAGAGVPTPAPLRRRDGGLVSVLRGKPAALFPWLDGTMRCQAGVTRDDARTVGEALARVHVAGAGEKCGPGRFDIPGILGRLDRIEASGSSRFAPFAAVLRASVERVRDAQDPTLARGLIHGDLFRDNVLWNERGTIAALLDFESACEGTFAYDLMVTVLSWCVADDLRPELAQSMREGYEHVRPLSEAEKAALYTEGRLAALRFTTTRITDYAMRDGASGPRVVKDWRRFLKRFETLEALGPTGVRRALGV